MTPNLNTTFNSIDTNSSFENMDNYTNITTTINVKILYKNELYYNKNINNNSKYFVINSNNSNIVLSTGNKISNLYTQILSYSSLVTNISTTLNQNSSSEKFDSLSQTQNNSTNDSNAKESQIQEEFKKVQSIPYNEATMNCQVKSKIFADYLLKNGESGINLVIIEHDSGKYSHEFVEWNGHYYDPCNSELSYEKSEQTYIQELRNLGFDGPVFESPYLG